MVLVIPKEAASPMPRLGLGVASHRIPMSSQEVARLCSLQLNHLRTDLRLTDPTWPQFLSSAVTEAEQLGVALELAVHLGPDGSLSALEECGAKLKRIRVPVARILAFRQSEPATSFETLRFARHHLRLPEVTLGGGTDSHFCELNREQALGRFGLAEADFIAWPTTPQVHLFDDLSVMENLEAQPHTLTTARSFAGNKPLCISPITLRPRFNAVDTREEPPPDLAKLPPEVDPRQLSMFNAAWMLGSIAGLAAAKATSLTYFETTGWRGLMESPTPLNRHPLFPSIPGRVFPVCHVFATMAGFSRMAVVTQGPSTSRCGSNPIAALCLFDPQGRRRVLCANLTSQCGSLVLDLGVHDVSLRMLTSEQCDGHSVVNDLTWSEAAPHTCPNGTLKLALTPYAIVSVDTDKV
jgi:hypothetical protein